MIPPFLIQHPNALAMVAQAVSAVVMVVECVWIARLRKELRRMDRARDEAQHELADYMRLFEVANTATNAEIARLRAQVLSKSAKLATAIDLDRRAVAIAEQLAAENERLRAEIATLPKRAPNGRLVKREVA